MHTNTFIYILAPLAYVFFVICFSARSFPVATSVDETEDWMSRSVQLAKDIRKSMSNDRIRQTSISSLSSSVNIGDNDCEQSILQLLIILCVVLLIFK